MSNDFNLNLTVLPNEIRLLLLLMKTENGKAAFQNHNELLREIDWDRFLHLSRHHRVYPLIYTRLKALDDKRIPPFVLQSLYHEYRKNTFQMLHLSGEMDHVCKVLTENKIRSLFLKGPVLASNLYGDVSLRTSGDLDILISLDDLDRVEELILKLGYVKDDYIQTVLNDWKWRHHHLSYFHPKNGIKLEIHWRMNPGPAKEPSFNDLWERKRISSLTDYPVCFLGREDLFLFLVTHGARHGWSRLRWLTDIDKLVKQDMDWNQLTLLLKKYQSLHLGGQALVLASQLLNTPVIEEMKTLTARNRPRRLAQDALFYISRVINLHTNPVSEEVARYHKRHLFRLMHVRQKLLFIMSFLYPYPEDAKVLPLPKIFHFLYFPLRPVLWALRKTRNQVPS